MRHEIIVGNIGSVYRGSDDLKAENTFNEYVEQSKTERGRAGGEDVVWFRCNEPYREFVGSLSESSNLP